MATATAASANSTSAWRRQLDVVLRQEHRAGEKLFVDYAGATIPVHDPPGGPVCPASIFVAVLGASNYTYAEATGSQELEDWIGSHIRAFEFLGGVPKLVVIRQHPQRGEPGLPLRTGSEPRPITKWPCTTAWGYCPPGPTSPATRPRSKTACR